ncbi:MAG: hypothetical protein OXI75_12095 [Rhodospirillales bacterium]|nr:hypothetical protein [Rhodospirillales bacterium]
MGVEVPRAAIEEAMALWHADHLTTTREATTMVIEKAELLVVNVSLSDEGRLAYELEVNPLVITHPADRVAEMLYSAANTVRAFADEAARTEEPNEGDGNE